MNHRNRLAAASVGGTQVGAYVYDALERLAIRTTSNVSPAGTTHFAYDLSGKVLIEANGANGATVREYVWFNDMPLAIVADVDTASPQLLHVHADHLDRPIMLTSTSKANVWEAVYRPFGEVHAITGTATQNLRFPGQFFLFETGLAHNWHRTYDATIGRYLQADPLGFVAGSSVYSYALNSPHLWTDRDGRCPWCIAFFFGAISAGAIDLFYQAIVEDRSTECINWSQVTTSMLLGGLSSGLGPVTSLVVV